jgi:hypothetical protein
MLLAPKIAPISDREIGESNTGFFAEYFIEIGGWAFVSPKVG